MRSSRFRCLAALILAATLSTQANAHGDAHKPSAAPTVKEQKAWGIAGDPKKGLRTIRVSMGDAMRFTPQSIAVKEGETVRFLVRNDGKLMHEFVLGTRETNAEHAALMVKFPGMEHEEPYMAHVAPGATGEIVWTFNRAGQFEFACLIAGHYQSGMVGTVVVTPRPRSTVP